MGNCSKCGHKLKDGKCPGCSTNKVNRHYTWYGIGAAAIILIVLIITLNKPLVSQAEAEELAEEAVRDFFSDYIAKMGVQVSDEVWEDIGIIQALRSERRDDGWLVRVQIKDEELVVKVSSRGKTKLPSIFSVMQDGNVLMLEPDCEDFGGTCISDGDCETLGLEATNFHLCNKMSAAMDYNNLERCCI